MEFQPIFELENQFQADLIASVLDAETVPHLIKVHPTDGLEPAFQMQNAYGVVLVPEAARELALSLIEEAMSARSVPEDAVNEQDLH